jgi:hypothetical protein
MLDGAKLIITPLEGGGYEISEHGPTMNSNDVFATIGLAVVMVGVTWGIITLADALTDRFVKKIS